MLKTAALTLAATGDAVVLGASGKRSVRSLAAFARLTGLRCSGLNEIPDVLLTDEIPADGTAALSRGPDAPFYQLAGDRFAVVSESDWPFHLSGDWPGLLGLGGIRKLLQGKFVIVLHGALLEIAPGCGAIVFGPGGVGKSTTVARFRGAGGDARADDIMLLSLCNGVLTAFPLPTRSYYSAHWTNHLRYPHEPGVVVKKLLLLERGSEREELVRTGTDRWRAALLEAMTMYFSAYVRRLPVDRKRRYGNTVLDYADKLTAMFPPLEFRAKLNADIMKTLGEVAPC